MAGPCGEVPFESLQRLDSDLSAVARRSGVLRVLLAEGLEALGRAGGCAELGFPTVEALALERCGRSARWVQESRALARRLGELPALRGAVAAGEVSFSMAQVLAKVARTEDEEWWIAEARGRTVRAMREVVKERAARVGRLSAVGDEAAVADEAVVAEGARVTLTVTVDREEGWLFECARMRMKRLGDSTLEATVEALLGEGTTSMLGSLERSSVPAFEEWVDTDGAQRAWEAELRGFREEAEVRCEGRLGRWEAAGCEGFEADWDGDAEHVDSELRRVAAELARRDVVLGELAESFWMADGWRRLGYATESQYARERLGMSLSSVKAKRALARRARALPRLRDAVDGRELGFEAARLVAVVASPETADVWVERARARTVKHLREEVDAAQMLSRLRIDPAMRPPEERTMEELAAIERRVTSGEVIHGVSRQMSAAPPLHDERSQMSAEGREGSRGRLALKFRVRAGTRRYYRWLEGVFRRRGPRGVSFLRYLCLVFIAEWTRQANTDEAYSRVYERDGYRCTNPVCSRRDVTPHHLLFRSAGGDDSEENVASLCVWCHLEGVHGGRLAVAPPASAMEWRIGRRAHTIVKGRSRVDAESQ